MVNRGVLATPWVSHTVVHFLHVEWRIARRRFLNPRRPVPNNTSLPPPSSAALSACCCQLGMLKPTASSFVAGVGLRRALPHTCSTSLAEWARPPAVLPLQLSRRSQALERRKMRGSFQPIYGLRRPRSPRSARLCVEGNSTMSCPDSGFAECLAAARSLRCCSHFFGAAVRAHHPLRVVPGPRARLSAQKTVAQVLTVTIVQ